MRHTSEAKPPKRRILFPGVTADARALGVHLRTLERVLGGQWKSKILTARYRQLKGLPLSRPQALLISEYQRRQAEKAVTAQQTSAPSLIHP